MSKREEKIVEEVATKYDLTFSELWEMYAMAVSAKKTTFY